MSEVQSQIKPSIENLADFLERQKNQELELNNKIQVLIQELKEKKGEPTILFSQKFEETVFHLSEDIRGVFDYQYHKYPENGLFLRSLEIVHNNSVGNIELSFSGFISLVVKTNDENWNGEIPLSRVAWDDEDFRIVENSMGHCYEPRFSSKEKYFEVRSFIQAIQDQLKTV